MPIYEYECSACGNRQEYIQKMSDAPMVECPQCGKPTLKRLVSAPAFQLKGTGWYVTDFRDQNKSEHKTDHNKSSHMKGLPAHDAKPDPKETVKNTEDKPVKNAEVKSEKSGSEKSTSEKKVETNSNPKPKSEDKGK